VVDVVLPLYLAATAVATDAYDRLRFPDRERRRRLRWHLDVAERIAFPRHLPD
jgi:hypothetical protein